MAIPVDRGGGADKPVVVQRLDHRHVVRMSGRVNGRRRRNEGVVNVNDLRAVISDGVADASRGGTRPDRGKALSQTLRRDAVPTGSGVVEQDLGD